MVPSSQSPKSNEKTLATELQKIEKQAEQGLAADGHSYSRAQLARETGVSGRALNAWLSGDRAPRNDDQLMRIVRILALWADVPTPPEQNDWIELLDIARKRNRSADTTTRRAGDIHDDVSIHRAWFRRPVLWIGGIVASAIATTLASWLTSSGQHLLNTTHVRAGPPFTWTISRSPNELNLCAAWVFQQPIGQIPMRPFGGVNNAPADESWAMHNGGVDADQAAYTLTLQGTTSDNVAIQDVRVRLLARKPAARGIFVSSGEGCGGLITVRYFEAALESASPQLVPAAGTVGWPYTISGKQIEELCLEASVSSKYEYSYIYDIDWAQGGVTGTVEIRAPGGRPFVLTPAGDRGYFSNNGKWIQFGGG